MTSFLPRLRRRRRRPRPEAPLDPTRPGPLHVHDGVPIVHEGPPGYPGPAPDDEAGRDGGRDGGDDEDGAR